MVYFGFEDPQEVMALLQPFSDYRFVYYGAFAQQEDIGHITLKPFSRIGFQQDLARSVGVMTNAGFELASEAIHSGKKLLVKPVSGQVEQLSNALALEQLGLGKSMQSLDGQVVHDWLHHFHAKGIRYPNVAKAIVNWLAEGNWNKGSRDTLAMQLWAGVDNLPCSNDFSANQSNKAQHLAAQY